MSSSLDDEQIGADAVADGMSGHPGAFTRVRVLGKVRDILDLFTLETPELDMVDLRRLSKLPSSTCSRLVQNMVLDGLLDQRGTGRFRIGIGVVRWAAVAREGLGLTDVGVPELRRLRDTLGETTGLFVRDGRLRVCIALAEGTHVVGRRLTLGHVAPLHANAAGKAILAFDPEAMAAINGVALETFTASTKSDPQALAADLVETRARGYALSNAEWHEEVFGAAAPVFDADRLAVASVGVSVPASRLAEVELAALGEAVAEAADRITVALGGR